MTKLGATDRARRLLAIVPWVAARDGVGIDEICERFEIRRAQLLGDLETLQFVGVAPYTPDQLVEVVVEDDRVWIHLPQAFDRPVRLSSDQALSLLVAARGASSVHGDDDGPLGRALEKLATALRLPSSDAVDVDLATADATLLDRLATAVAEHRCVELDYYAFGRDRRDHRIVEPHRLSAFDGNWYLAGHCRSAEAERVFRVDRMSGVTVLEERFAPPEEVPEIRPLRPDDLDGVPRVELEVESSGRWVVDAYPVEEVTELPEGRLRVVLPVTAEPWLARLLLILGPSASLVGGDPGFATTRADAAARVLARYEVGAGQGLR